MLKYFATFFPKDVLIQCENIFFFMPQVCPMPKNLEAKLLSVIQLLIFWRLNKTSLADKVLKYE
jgi:hypothetical protein